MALTQISTKGIKDGTITNLDINASAAIAGTKINPDFGSQDITTTGIIPATHINIAGVTTSAARDIIFSTNNDGSARTVAVDSTAGKFSYNPSENRLFVDNINMPDNGRLNLGDGTGTAGDLQIYFDGIGAVIKNTTGNLFVQSIGDVKLRTNDSELAVNCIVNSAVELYHNSTSGSPSKKLETTTDGIKVTGNIDLSAEFNMTEGSDAQRFFDAAVGTSALTFRGCTGGDANHEEMARFFRGGGCELNHAGNKRLETTSIGISVTGGITSSSTGNAFLILDSGTSSEAGNQVSFIDFKIDGTLKGNIAINEAVSGTPLEINSSGAGATKLYDAGSEKLSTTSSGIEVTGSVTATSDIVLSGELNMTTDGNKNRFIDCSLADNQALFVRATTNGDANHEDMALFHRNLGVDLFFDGQRKFKTISTGARIENTGTANRLGTGAGSAADLLQLHQEDASNATTYDFMNYRFTNGSTHASSEMRFRRHVDVTDQGYFGLRDQALTFGYGNSELMRLTGGGSLGIGLESPSYKLHVKSGNVDQTARFDNSKTGDNNINYIGVGLNSGTTGVALFGHTGHSTASSQAAWFGLGGDAVDAGVGVKVFRGGGVFMAAQLNIGNNNTPNVQARISTSSPQFGAFLETTGNTAANGIPLIVNRQVDNGVMIEFKQANGVVATIHRNSSNQMVYGGTSDYRLKENNVVISDSLTKVKSLKPYEFNWKDLPDTKVLGFFAHELQEVVPQAVTGTKDEMYEDDDTKPKYQNVDNSHIVPLLVAAVQELTTKTEALETEVAALKAS